MAETIVALGGQEYVVRRLPVGKALEWRKQANSVVAQIVPLREKYGADVEEEELIKGAGELLNTADGLIEAMLECVLAASPELKKDRQHILDNAFDEELMEAFERVLMLNVPLAGAASSITA